jgi:hypothetical protein
MRFLGIEIEKKTDVLAFAAFLLSIGSLLGQVAILFRGAHVFADGPKQITLFFANYGQSPDQLAVLNAITNQVYVNNGAIGYNDILKSEKIQLSLSELSLELKAQYSVQSARAVEDGRRLEFSNQAPWRPVLIKAGNFQDTETIFVPYPSSTDKKLALSGSAITKRDSSSNQDKKIGPRGISRIHHGNAIPYEVFVRYLHRSPHIDVILTSDTYGGQRLQTKCRTTLASREIISELNSKRCTSLECLASSSHFPLINQLLLRLSREV